MRQRVRIKKEAISYLLLRLLWILCLEAAALKLDTEVTSSKKVHSSSSPIILFIVITVSFFCSSQDYIQFLRMFAT